MRSVQSLLVSLGIVSLAAAKTEVADWTYHGCFNETTEISDSGVRALNGGKNDAFADLTVESCVAYCHQGEYKFAGLEYGK